MANHGQLLRGRQMLLIILDWFRLAEIEGACLEFKALIAIQMQDGNLEKFMDKWHNCM